MAIDNTKIQKVKTAMDNRYENKQSNKKTSISGSYTGDNDSYPTVLACLNKFGELITTWSAEASDSKYPSEKLVKTELDKKIDKSSTVGLVKNDGTIDTTQYISQHQSLTNYIQKSQTSGLVKNDGTIDTNNYITSASLPTKTSDLSNDGEDGTNSYVATNDSRLTDARTPKSHTHGNLTNDGKVGSSSGKIITTTTGGKIQASDSITKSMISDFPTSMTPSSHTHGDITNDGKLGSTANLPLITGTGGKISVGSFGTSANSFCEGNDSRLSDARTPTSHTHGNLSNDGKLGSTANKPVITTTGGAITTGSFGTSSNTFAEGNHNHDGVYLKTHQSLSDIGGEITVEKQTTAETGYIATYVIKQGTSSSKTQVGEKINIPKDYLVKSATLETCTVPDTPVAGYVVGDKYLDFVINTKDSSGTDNHLYILVSDLIDTYTADNSTLQLSDNQFSVKNGGIGTTQLASGVVTSLGYADNWNSSPAKTITSQQITDWDTMVSGGITISDVDNEINSALDALAEAIYPTS